jgi:AraC-like DNA-binding protein
MSNALRDTIRCYAEAHADPHGIARTPIPGMTAVRGPAPTELQYAIQRPLICLVAQGTKEVLSGTQALSFDAGDSMLITADVPTRSRIIKASRIAPYLSFALYLDPALVIELAAEMQAIPADQGGPVRLQPTDAEVADTALRLLRLLDRPASVPMLSRQLVREMHYWLLMGRHGPAIRQLAAPDGRAARIARAVELIRADFAQPLKVEDLAAAAGMSASSFHQHFRAVTSLSPLQFQKQYRLVEARRLMLSEGMGAGHAAFAVGYESVSQFTREYARLFGLPPVREIEAARRAAMEVA